MYVATGTCLSPEFHYFDFVACLLPLLRWVEVEASLGNSTRRSCSRKPSTLAAGDDTAAFSYKVGCADSLHHSGTPNLMATATLSSCCVGAGNASAAGNDVDCADSFRHSGIPNLMASVTARASSYSVGAVNTFAVCSWQRYRHRSVARECRA